MLDLGSGASPHKEIVEELGFEWVGLDFDAKEAPILGDAHALPFKDDQFEFVLSIQTFEHLNYPFIAAKEVFRTLKPGGKFIGTVSFLEPYHQYSFFHQTHLGVRALLTTAGFTIDAISPHPRTALQALGKMSLFRPLPLWLVKLLVWPTEMTHRIWWKLGFLLTHNPRASETYRQFSTASSFMFIATKS
jgi:SAM-dependent methyltransferase